MGGLRFRVNRRRALLALGAVVGSSVVGCDALAGDGAAGTVRSLLGDTGTAGPTDLPGKIAFVRGGDVVQWSGGATKVVAHGQRFADPAWAPDGSRLAAIVSGTNHSDLVILRPDGMVVRKLTQNLSNVAVKDSAWARKPAWSADGARLAYVSDRDKHDMSLWLVTADGGQPAPLLTTKPYSGGVDWPTWSPSGREIAYTTFVDGPAQVRAVNLTSRQERTLADDPGGDFDPAWSPDGRFVAYVARNGDDDRIMLVSADGAARVAVTATGMYRAPTWSPPGDALAFVGRSADGFSVFVVRLSLSGTPTASTPRPLPETLGVEAAAGLSWGGS